MSAVDEYVKNQLLLNREAFRAENTEFLRALTVADRILCQDLGAIGVSTAELLQIFRDQTAPTIKLLEAKRDGKTLKSYLMKNLGFSGLATDMAVNYLVETRRSQVITDFITKIGGQDNEGKLRSLLNRPVDELLGLFGRYHNYRRALDLSEENGLALVDPYASRLKRRKMRKSVRRDQRATVRHEKKRLRQIERDMADLFSSNRLLSSIVDKNWSFVEILDLNHQYQKRLSKVKKVSPATKIEIFEEITAGFRYSNTEALAAGGDGLGLKDLQCLGEDIYNLLLEVFDMDNTGRNRLMTEVRIYSGLASEREQLQLARRNREEFLNL